jgi:hypothetical protein
MKTPNPSTNNPNPNLINHHSQKFILLMIRPQVPRRTVAQTQGQMNGARPQFSHKTQMNTLLKMWLNPLPQEIFKNPI